MSISFGNHPAFLDPSKVHPKYGYYSMVMAHSKAMPLVGWCNVSKQMSIWHLARSAINIPLLDEQQRIADILSAYDDLIENNRRRMALLEDAARQLYHEWFVRLRFPGHEHTRIINGVPERWDRKTLCDLSEEITERPCLAR